MVGPEPCASDTEFCDRMNQSLSSQTPQCCDRKSEQVRSRFSAWPLAVAELRNPAGPAQVPFDDALFAIVNRH
jgi:hypothetical protein